MYIRSTIHFKIPFRTLRSRRRGAYMQRRVVRLIFVPLRYHVYTRYPPRPIEIGDRLVQPPSLPPRRSRHGLFVPPVYLPGYVLQVVAIAVAMQRHRRVYIVAITSSQVFTTTRRHQTHLYLFSGARPCCIRVHLYIRIYICMRVTVCHHREFVSSIQLRASQRYIVNVETGEAFLRAVGYPLPAILHAPHAARYCSIDLSPLWKSRG